MENEIRQCRCSGCIWFESNHGQIGKETERGTEAWNYRSLKRLLHSWLEAITPQLGWSLCVLSTIMLGGFQVARKVRDIASRLGPSRRSPGMKRVERLARSSNLAAAPEFSHSTCSIACHSSILYGTVTCKCGFELSWSPSPPRHGSGDKCVV